MASTAGKGRATHFHPVKFLGQRPAYPRGEGNDRFVPPRKHSPFFSRKGRVIDPPIQLLVLGANLSPRKLAKEQRLRERQPAYQLFELLIGNPSLG